MTSPWYRRIFPTRLAAHRQAVQEFVTTRQGYRLATILPECDFQIVRRLQSREFLPSRVARHAERRI
jgi:hypothetical protein